MMNSVQINSGKGMKRTRDGSPKAKAQALLESQERKQNPSNGRLIMDLIGKYNDFHIMKERCIIEQIFDLQFIVGELHKHKVPIPEKFQIGMLIAKLPLLWRHFATSVWQHEEEMCMDDLVASIIEENVKTTLQNLNHGKTDIEACWACRKGGCKSDSCRRPKSATQMVKKMIMNNATACSCCEVEKNFKVKIEHSIVQELQKGKNNDSTPTKEMCKIEEMGSGSGACWSCRKMGYMTDICKRRSNKIEKEFHQKKRHRSEITHTKKSRKLVLRSCWTCRKKSHMAVCCDCQKNIIEIQSQNLQA